MSKGNGNKNIDKSNLGITWLDNNIDVASTKRQYVIAVS
jgi:hypothetical protein